MSDLVPARQKTVDIMKMSVENQEKARRMAEGIDISDSNAIIQYGVGAQSKISGFADSILTEIRSKDSGYVGDTLSELVVTVKNVDVDGLTGSGSGLSKMLGGLKRKVQKFMTRYQKLSTQIDTIVNQLDKARMTLLKDITMLDTLYQKNVEYLGELDLIIAAGQVKVEQIKTEVIPRMEEAAQSSGDPMDAQKLQDMNQLLNRFEKKLHDLLLSRMISIQTAPQIRLIQGNDQTLVEKIQSSILNTIPLWKNQIVIAIGLYRQKEALELQKKVTETTNDLLAKNSEMLKQGSIEVARESERGIVEIETLKKVNNDLISTIEETLRIQREGKQKRAAAEAELVQMEGDLKKRLSTVGTS